MCLLKDCVLYRAQQFASYSSAARVQVATFTGVPAASREAMREAFMPRINEFAAHIEAEKAANLR
jgi:hypothetical protein